MSFYRCRHCGNIVTYLKSSGVKIKCCGENMEEMEANSTEASVEKHLPVFTKEGQVVKVNVGGGTHPQILEHHIEWIELFTNEGRYRKTLDKEGKPCATFILNEDENVIEVYAYCNLHGLWVVKE